MIKDAFKKQNTKCCTGNQGFIQQRAPNKKITLELWQDPSPLPFGQSPNSIRLLVEKPSPHKLRKESVVKQSKFRMHTKGDTGENGNSFYNSQVATLVRMNTRRILIKLVLPVVPDTLTIDPQLKPVVIRSVINQAPASQVFRVILTELVSTEKSSKLTILLLLIRI